MQHWIAIKLTTRQEGTLNDKNICILIKLSSNFIYINPTIVDKYKLVKEAHKE